MGVSLIAALMALSLVSEPGTTCVSHDYSNRVSLLEPRSAASFDTEDLDGFTGGEKVSIRLDGGGYLGQRPHQGKGVMLVTPDEDAPALRTVRKEFPQPEDFSSTPLAEFSIFTQEGPAIDQFVSLTLFSGKREFTATAQIIPTLWRTVIFDLSECPFLSKVESLEIGLVCPGDEPWKNGRAFLLDDLRFGKALDLGFMLPSSVAGFESAEGSAIKWKSDALKLRFRRGAELRSPDLTGSRNHMFEPPLDDRNTFFVVMENKSKVDRVRLSWETIDGKRGSKEFDIVPRSKMRAYYFNISDVPEACGSLKGFSLESLEKKGRGTWKIAQIRFEREDPIIRYGGGIASCVADTAEVEIQGNVDKSLLGSYSTIEVYEYPMKMEGSSVDQLVLLAKAPVKETFDLSFPNSRLSGRMTHLSSRFLAVLRNDSGESIPLDKPFYIGNWRDFTENPYSFELPDRDFQVLRYGAKGDAFTDDTKAIQKAVDACAAAGGGRVVFTGTDEPYGRRYVATHITMRSGVELHLEKGAVLWQSYDLRDYDYIPAYGHDFDIPGCPWTHCLFINYPLIQGNFLENVKITGPGVIRMSDPYSVNPDWDHYARTCSDRIHICPVGICDSKQIEFTDIDILRCNNYHTNFPAVDSIFVGNVKLHEVQCVSGDGFSFGQGARHIRVERCFFDSNDDGIVMSDSYRDPRGKISPWRKDDDDADHSIRDIKVEHSYINSSTKGAGKAIAFIPWGTTNPDLTKQEIDGVQVYDCVLEGGHSVGTWCDNPHDGKPFDNNERDDYAPVKNVRILGNEYRSLCDMLWVKPTNFITDCGLHSSSDFVNGDFSHGHCYWTMEGDAGAENVHGFAKGGGRLYEGLHLEYGGRYTFIAEVSGKGTLFVRTTLENETVASKEFDIQGDGWKILELGFKVSLPCPDCDSIPLDYSLGIESHEQAMIRNVRLRI